MDSSQYRFNNFDLIRLLAALQVVLIHAHEHFSVSIARSTTHPAIELLTNGVFDLLSLFPGVQIFFITSGFLITGAYRRNPNLRDYVTNRILRLYPALFACFGVSVLLVVFVFQASFTASEITTWAVAQLSAVQFYNPDFLRPFGVGALNGSLWTISVELQFYVLLPMALLLFDRLHWDYRLMVLVLLVLAVFNRLLLFAMQDGADTIDMLYMVSVIPHLFSFLCGVLLYHYMDRLIPLVRNRFMWCLALYMVLSGLCHWTGMVTRGNHVNPLLIIVLAVLVLSFAYSCVTRLSRVLRGMDISYGVYIYHMLVINVLLHVSVFSPWTNLLLTVFAALMLGTASWWLVERPMLALKRRSVRPVGQALHAR